MVARTQGIGGLKENMLCVTLYIACYGFAYYKADPEKITDKIFEGKITAPPVILRRSRRIGRILGAPFQSVGLKGGAVPLPAHFVRGQWD